MMKNIALLVIDAQAVNLPLEMPMTEIIMLILL